jgi:hypothetical protein
LFRRASRGALYERLLEEKNAHIRILVAEIDYLRAMRGQPSLPARITPDAPSAIPDGQPGAIDDGEWLSEAEEAEKIVSDLGLSPVHLPEILEGLGLGTSDLS